MVAGPVGQTVNLACAINQHYALALAVMLRSLLAHTRSSIHLYCLYTQLDASFRDFVSSQVETTWVQVNIQEMATLPICGHLSSEAYLPLFLSDCLPRELARVLFLDADLLVLSDINELWQEDLQGLALGAVQDLAIPFVSSPRGLSRWPELGLDGSAPYFNGGVLLLDLEQWRARQIARQALDYLKEFARPGDFLHQDALNGLLAGGWKKLPLRWNLTAGLIGRSFFRVSLPDYTEALRQPGIVHFSGRCKPWWGRTGSIFDPLFQERRVGLEDWGHPPTWKQRCLCFYDRWLRARLYRIERLLWENRRL